MYGADHTHHLGLAPLILTNGKHPMFRRAPLQPRELGTHLRMGGLVRTLMGEMGRKEESIFSNRRVNTQTEQGWAWRPPTRLAQGEYHRGKSWGSTQWDKTMQVCRRDQEFKSQWCFSHLGLLAVIGSGHSDR